MQVWPVRGATPQAAQETSIPGVARVDRNVVFGMYSGLALLMDVYRPEKPNGYGAIFILGSGWAAPPDYGARPLKNAQQESRLLYCPLRRRDTRICDSITRATPRFHYPAKIEDADRAVRFVRFYAKQFGINPNRIAAVGYSSGAHLASLLGLMDGAGDNSSRDPVQRERARVQCVVAGGTPADLAAVGNNPEALALLSAFLGEQVPANPAAASALRKKLEDASPIHYVKLARRRSCCSTATPMNSYHMPERRNSRKR